MNAARGSAESEPRLSMVRETALRETAYGLGTRLGLLQRSREIAVEVAKRDRELDKRFDFGGLMMGPGVLPPVIMENTDAISLEATTMRVSNAIYKIDEPARFVAISPTWRDWLLMGLPTEDAADMTAVKSLLPRDAAEQAFWKREVAQAVAAGRSQAQQIFDLNVATLEKTYFGMRLFYDLWKRGMVTVPVVASAQTMVDRENPNTIAVGNTMFRITQQAGFADTSRWKPLE
ncbi:MAG: type IV secretory system conjugative DNA transfer family protein [Proteobacteria bacterium]|nr:type IV secretory system conjugative DNA transfer family protein [Pseudomonadota bacterium]